MTWDYQAQTAPGLARQFTPAIRKQLESEFTGEESPAELLKLVRKLVLRQLHAAPAPALAR